MSVKDAASVTNLSTIEQRYRQFAHEYLTGGYNGSLAYRRVYGMALSEASARASAARLLANVNVQRILTDLAEEASARNRVDQNFVISCWKAMTEADTFDYFRISDDPKTEGHLVMISTDLNELTKEQRQNVKKLRIRNRTTSGESKEGSPWERHEQIIELEIIDRAKAVENIAKTLGLYREKK